MSGPEQWRWHPRSVLVLAAVIGAGTGLVACGNDETPNALRPVGDEASTTAAVWWYLLITASVVGVVFVGLILWGALRPPRPNPRRLGDDSVIGIGGVLVPSIVLIATAVVTLAATAMMRPAEAAPDAVHIEIVGHQYWWEITYPDSGVVTANELTMPTDRPVELSLRSVDVIHSFWVPELAGKQDLIPGQTNRLELIADEPGSYFGVCAEFCGIQHAGMGIVVHVIDGADFDEWTTRHGGAAPVGSQPATDLEQRGAEVFAAEPCGGCHRIAGTDADGHVGPDLTLLAERDTIGAGVLDNTPENLARWITSVQDVKPGAQMQNFDVRGDDLDALVAFLEAER